MFKILINIVLYFGLAVFSFSASAAKINCQKQAEAIGIAESKKKGNLPDNLLSVANPTEVEDKAIVVYIGAHAKYNYFKMILDKDCKLKKIVDVEYAQ